ncbi:MAG: XRE family transcriptional regulator [Gammaproteobacteria bacterium]|nr:MAG: XRE family transcriptional regulator [Gammaproteobacteria bacterium]
MSWLDRLTHWTGRAVDLAQTSASTSIRAGKALLDNPEKLERMARAGQSLKELRQVAGLTLSELAEAVDLKDKTLLEAVEAGTATLSFDLIMRLAAVLARNDPIPFVLKYTRTYNPETWKLLEEWGIGRLPVQYERERRFLNILRSRDEARDLSDADFDKILAFTESAFDMALHFARPGAADPADAPEPDNSKQTTT